MLPVKKLRPKVFRLSDGKCITVDIPEKKTDNMLLYILLAVGALVLLKD